MGNTSGALDRDPASGPSHPRFSPARPDRSRHAGVPPRVLLAFIVLLVATPPPAARGDTLATVRQAGRLTYGSDKEGGGPYAFPDPASPRDVTGFEVELMNALAGKLGV